MVTNGEEIVSNKSEITESSDLAPCSQEEADTRIFVHMRHATANGSSTVTIKANDTDVVIIAISCFQSFKAIGLEKLWIAFGQGAHSRWIPIHDIVSTIGPERSSGLPFFHAFSGCDVVSAFRGKAKKSVWQTWNVCDEVSGTLTKLSHWPTTVDDDDLQMLERFVVIMYDRSSAATSVNDARLHLFARKQRPYDAIPPTSAALKEHIKRAAYQAGAVWGQATVTQPVLPSPAEWGWKLQGQRWLANWTTLPPIAASCQELAKCSCKNSCTNGRFKCFRLTLSCTALCSCECH